MGMLTTMKVFSRGPVKSGPLAAAAAHKPTLLGKLAMERWVGVSKSVDGQLKSVAQLRAASMIGCMW